ncbi:TetR/AcrR family transcriptional regulator [Paraburkholderia sp. LEh10]|uniref:TetR/AcrR family transcriptional regulator n=1 Tax=Paraburkholderia sp. LEh10 TaxID=2821353 RepID=UPI001AE37516|nr:TetR/AcrR family transcriptional regulator [Paraburkholderia sp. LEh10]MBP0594671.1 TetR/AcrR family transcriptional regulator [Paraburkholderia sp. LEh10]
MANSETAKPAPSRRAQTAGSDAQQHLLRAAAELFYREGVRAVGVDAVVERAGVNKMSLYRQFSSKDDLVVAYLEQSDEQFFRRVEESFAKHPGEPKKQIVQYFEDLAERASKDDYRGCPFVNVSAEFPDPSHPARLCVLNNKTKLMQRLNEICTAAGARDPGELANGLALLIEGIYASSQTYGPGCGPIKVAPLVAAQLVAQACGDAPVK